jgi:prepilin-type N-terminal cleavage/methylation domain-containing protein
MSNKAFVMKKILNNINGFTLLEIIISLVIMTIISVIAGMGLFTIAKGYLYAKANATIAQQGQIATTRLKKEFGVIKSISFGATTTITFRSTRNPSEDVSICWAGGNNPLLIKLNATDCNNGDKLVDNVNSFSLAYCDTFTSCSSSYSPTTTSIIEITLKLTGVDGSTIAIAEPDRIVLNLETGG